MYDSSSCQFLYLILIKLGGLILTGKKNVVECSGWQIWRINKNIKTADVQQLGLWLLATNVSLVLHYCNKIARQNIKQKVNT